MKKITIVAVLTLLCLTFIPWSTCAAADELFGCAKNDNGQLRIVDDHSECLPSEVPMTLGGYATEPRPNVVTVNCNNPEESVQDALDNAPDFGRFTVYVNGICQECVNIWRNYVTLRGSDPAADGLNCPSAGTLATILINGAQKGKYENLNLTGAQRGIHAWNSATFEARNLIVHDTGWGISLDMNSTATLIESTMRNLDFGISAGRDSSLMVWGGVVEDIGVFGVDARSGGSVSLQPPPWGGAGTIVKNCDFHAVTASDGGHIALDQCTVEDNDFGVFAINGGSVVVQGNNSVIQRNTRGGVGANDNGSVSLGGGVHVANNPGHGVSGRSGASLSLGDVIIEGNGSDAVSLGGGSTASIVGTQIINNFGHGISLGATSVATFFDDSVVVTGNTGAAVKCFNPTFGGIVGQPGTMNSNGGGNIVDCLPGLFP